jgi:hypothetical protein
LSASNAAPTCAQSAATEHDIWQIEIEGAASAGTVIESPLDEESLVCAESAHAVASSTFVPVSELEIGPPALEELEHPTSKMQRT